MAMSCWSDAGMGTAGTGIADTGTTDTAITGTITIIITAVTAIGASMRLRSSDLAMAIRALAIAGAAGMAIRGGIAGAFANRRQA